MRELLINEEFLQKVVDYLSTRPWGEVQGFMAELLAPKRVFVPSTESGSENTKNQNADGVELE
jgi:hypothetical protein